MKSDGDGWILIDRNIREHWIYSEIPVSRFQAWIDLILSANYQDKTILVNGSPLTIRRGSFLTSVRKLAIRWGWSKDKVLRFLAILRHKEMIKTETRIGTLVTIVNYGFYQSRRDRKRDTKKTPTGHRPDTDEIQEKERERKLKKEKEISADLNSDDDDDGMTMEEYDRMREAEKNGTV